MQEMKQKDKRNGNTPHTATYLEHSSWNRWIHFLYNYIRRSHASVDKLEFVADDYVETD